MNERIGDATRDRVTSTPRAALSNRKKLHGSLKDSVKRFTGK